MRLSQRVNQVREEAIALRLAGKSVREIREALGPVGKRTLSAALKDTPPAEWTRRPNAKDDLRNRAREMRRQGHSYNEIRAELGVSKSSVSLWVRDLPVPEHSRYVENENRKDGLRRFNQARAARNAIRHAAEIESATAEIGPLTNRELLLIGAIAYWCEGSKNKPYRKDNQVTFINSDPQLISFYLRFLDAAGVSRDDLVFRVHIHESADVAGSQKFWLDLTGAQPEQFRSPTLKHHNPKTVRKNIGVDYHGCLIIRVRRGSALYRRIEGWATGIMAA
jgi:hypothetical protein